jgi:hypothetical protein
MHKKTIIILAITALTLLTIVPVFAIKPAGPSSTNGLEKGKNDHLYLYEKNPDTWEIQEDPAWAKMNINNKQGKFVLNAHGLTPEIEYALICYQDEWPGLGSLSLGTGTADEGGNVHIKGPIDVENLPSYVYPIGEYDEEYPVEGSKIWLVLAEDYDSESDPDQMVGWTPTEYLFEFDLINQQIIE